jgi:hypothetical protein
MNLPPAIGFGPQPGPGGWGTASFVATSASAALQESIQQFHQQLNDTLHQQTASALANLSAQCVTAITADGINLNQVALTASSTVYLNTYFEGGLELRNITGYTPPPPAMANMDLTTYLGTSVAGVVPDANGLPSNFVVVGAVYFGLNAYQQNITLIHEALHTGSGLDDPLLAAQLGLGNNLSKQAASDSITDWLALGCAPVK